MKRYGIEITLKKEVAGASYRLDLAFETLAESFEEALQKAQRYYSIAQSEEQAAGIGFGVNEEVR